MKLITRLKRFLTPKTIIILLALVVLTTAVIYFFGPRLFEFFSNPDQVNSLIDQAGPWGPIIFIILQALQVILAPIPGNVTTAVGGLAFGWWGLPLTIIGSTLGFIAVVAISRRFGRPLLERFFSPAKIKKFDFLLEHKGGGVALFIIFLFPFMPDDLVGYLAGLTHLRFRSIILISIIGRLPMQALTNFFGRESLRGNLVLIIAILTVVAVLAVVVYTKRQWLENLIKADHHWEFIKKSFHKKPSQKR
jgi:uncharacterized membrane protein YdjX (TVP38/TMEM64 family)